VSAPRDGVDDDRLAIRGSPRIQEWVRTVSDFSFIAQASHDDFWLDLDYRVGFYDDRRSGRNLFNAFVSVARATVHQVKRVIRCRNLQGYNLCTHSEFRKWIARHTRVSEMYP
jgi:hypothetical protein